MKLADIIAEQSTVLMREAVRRHNHKLIKESRTPQSGAYWFIPLPDGSWDIEAFYDSQFSDTPHDQMWSRYVVERLATIWGKDHNWLRRVIGDNYTGLPRGRVNRILLNDEPGFSIVHGNDFPKGCSISGVLNVFNLKSFQRAHPDQVQIYYDHHETMISGDPKRVQKALGVDLGLKGAIASIY